MPKSIEASRGAAWPKTQPTWFFRNIKSEPKPPDNGSNHPWTFDLATIWQAESMSPKQLRSQYDIIQVRWTRHCNRPLRKSTSTRCPSLVETKIYCMDKTIGYIHYTDTDTQSVMNDNVDYGGLNLGEILSGNIAFAARLAIGITKYWKLILHFKHLKHPIAYVRWRCECKNVAANILISRHAKNTQSRACKWEMLNFALLVVLLHPLRNQKNMLAYVILRHSQLSWNPMPSAVQGSEIRPWATHHNSRDTMSRTFGLGLWSASGDEKWYKLEFPKKRNGTFSLTSFCVSKNSNKHMKSYKQTYCSIMFSISSMWGSFTGINILPRNRWPDFAPSRKTSGRQGSCLRCLRELRGFGWSCFELFRSVSSV